MKSYIINQLNGCQNVINQISTDPKFHIEIASIARICINSLRAGGKILLAGNGGSAADAQHMAGEYVSRFAFDRAALSAIALTTDTSILTAIGNDYGYEQVFARQIMAIGNPGDIFIGYTTSGQSPNILNAFVAAQESQIKTVAFLGNLGGPILQHSDYALQVPSDNTPRIQEAHAVLGHILCGLIEIEMFSSGDK